jgi:hypothetical protein
LPAGPGGQDCLLRPSDDNPSSHTARDGHGECGRTGRVTCPVVTDRPRATRESGQSRCCSCPGSMQITNPGTVPRRRASDCPPELTGRLAAALRPRPRPTGNLKSNIDLDHKAERALPGVRSRACSLPVSAVPGCVSVPAGARDCGRSRLPVCRDPGRASDRGARNTSRARQPYYIRHRLTQNIQNVLTFDIMIECSKS